MRAEENFKTCIEKTCNQTKNINRVEDGEEMGVLFQELEIYIKVDL